MNIIKVKSRTQLHKVYVHIKFHYILTFQHLLAKMGMRENWQRFVDLTKEKRDNHQKYANYWQSVHTILSLTGIFLAAMTTGLTLLSGIPTLATAGVAGATTLMSTNE